MSSASAHRRRRCALWGFGCDAGSAALPIPRVGVPLTKRIVDILVSAIGLVALAPLLALLAFLIIVSQGSPILFRQQRPGLRGEPFMLYKFRTMREYGTTEGRMRSDADRLTPFGRLLRRSSLDELPELYNVLRGEMSLVGPRPLLMEYLTLYTPEQARRHEVRPGLTGWAQVCGRNALSWEERFRLDVWYVDNRTLWLDMRIMVLTVWRIITGEGISEHGQVTMSKFRGTQT
jgi:sugar transferase EpsL